MRLNICLWVLLVPDEVRRETLPARVNKIGKSAMRNIAARDYLVDNMRTNHQCHQCENTSEGKVDKYIRSMTTRFDFLFEKFLNCQNFGRNICEDLLQRKHPFCSECPLDWFVKFFVGKMILLKINTINAELKVETKNVATRKAYKIATCPDRPAEDVNNDEDNGSSECSVGG